ncbi:MAG TPA: adenylate/guanylate cyclase domain-containing protein [Candidatus Acidoferrum sp.]|nr:adenylate/guanylate cyclase domain-containing protein [Candidatus Acidoferrum sp.]
MVKERTQRRLAAILAADVVGYSRLMEADEADTLAALKVRRKDVLEPLVAKHQGRVFKVTGDGVLVEFASAVNAFQCAVELQQAMAVANRDQPEDRHIVLRIGVNLGDVMVEGSDLYGDGVNIAARLETVAEPGGIVVSEDAHRQVRNKVDIDFDDLGPQSLKNIAEPVRAYRIAGTPPVVVPAPSQATLDKPSIAVLPFTNLSGDPDQEYFADGMVEEIVTALSRFHWLFVIARNSSFAYKGKAVDVKQVGRELGVRYVLEGSVRKAASRVRIAGQLVDAATGATLWADRFEGSLEDIFDLQDQVTASVVGIIAPRLQQAEIERAKRKPTESLDAYDNFLRGMAEYHLWTRAGQEEALSYFRRAIELDPNFASAYGMAARCYASRRAGGWETDQVRAVAETIRLARRATDLGRDDALALGTAGFALAWVAGEVEDGAALIDRAVQLNPNFAWGWLFSGWAKVWLGEPEVAIEHLARAMRLSPRDTHMISMHAAAACANFFLGRYAEAWTSAEAAIRERPEYGFPHCVAAASAALAGRSEEARKTMAHLRELMPELRIAQIRDFFPLRRIEHLTSFADGLRKAGLP